jgi:hypothetical protein
MKYDHIILGAGIYGLYSALVLAKKDRKVLVIEMDPAGFSRATFVNQARVHNGYHYPRSLSTAKKSAEYFNRFSKDFSFAINNKFKKIYSISKEFSYTSSEQFKRFCNNASIPCKKVYLNSILNKDVVEASFEVDEYSFDAQIIKNFFVEELSKYTNVTISYNTFPTEVKKNETEFIMKLNSNSTTSTASVINTTYASTNQIAQLFGFNKFKIKYEICEIILCDVPKNIKKIGITMMDGPFFSLMPFGKTGHHSLTSVTFTPHKTSYNNLPTFNCQTPKTGCSPKCLRNCNTCPNRPHTAWPYMNQLAQKYLVDTKITYLDSYFAIKPILKTSELDDSRPTVIRHFSEKPEFISILSGKINTIYDLDDILH